MVTAARKDDRRGLSDKARQKLAAAQLELDGASPHCVMEWLIELARAEGAETIMFEERPDPEGGNFSVGIFVLDDFDYQIEIRRSHEG